METDQINPTHYTSHPSGVECIDVTEHMTFNVGNAVKYLWRVGLKDSSLTDLRKAAWYVAREIERLAIVELQKKEKVENSDSQKNTDVFWFEEGDDRPTIQAGDNVALDKFIAQRTPDEQQAYILRLNEGYTG